MRTYEVVYVVQPELDEEGLTGLLESVTQTIAANGGEMVKTEPMGRRRLAYDLGRHSEANYVLVHAKMERQALDELDRRLKLSEDVLRYLVVRLDETA